MTITYDILINDKNGHASECLSNGIESKREAISQLKFYRHRFPEAYLVKIVQTRCRHMKGSA